MSDWTCQLYNYASYASKCGGSSFIQEKKFQGKTYSITEYTMSEIIASVYSKMEETGLKEGILFIDEINCVSETLAPTMLQFLQNKPSEIKRFRQDGSLWLQEIRVNIINQFVILML